MLCLASRHDCIEKETDPDRDCFRSGKVHATKMEREVCLNEHHSRLQQQQQKIEKSLNKRDSLLFKKKKRVSSSEGCFFVS